MSRTAIARRTDGRAVMDGSNACAVRWGTDVQRLRTYDTPEQAEQSLRLLCDEDDEAYLCDAETWGRGVRTFAVLSTSELERVMRTPGTFSFLLRWHLVPFTLGVIMAAIGGYQLWTYEPPKPSLLDGLVTSPAVEFFVPAMWASLVIGAIVTIRAYGKARSMAGR